MAAPADGRGVCRPAPCGASVANLSRRHHKPVSKLGDKCHVLVGDPPFVRRGGGSGGDFSLRYGFVRDIGGQPPVAMQRRYIERAGCDLLLEEGLPTRRSLTAQRDLLFGLKTGDALLVTSVDVLQMSTGDLVMLLRHFAQGGVALLLVSEQGASSVAFSGAARILSLLAANEELHPTRQRSSRRSRPRGKPLSRYQIDYAIDLKRRGASLRMIGLLFQMSPGELQKLINAEAREGSKSPPAEHGGQRRMRPSLRA